MTLTYIGGMQSCIAVGFTQTGSRICCMDKSPIYKHVNSQMDFVGVYLYPSGAEVVDVTDNGPAGHELEEVGQHVLLLGVPERVCKFTSILRRGGRGGDN